MALPRVPVQPDQRFGSLTVIKELPDDFRWGQRQHRCLVRCDCGVTREAYVSRLRKPDAPLRSCGAYEHRDNGIRPQREGQHVARMPEYGIWSAMKRRCLNPSVPEFPRYGGRGTPDL